MSSAGGPGIDPTPLLNSVRTAPVHLAPRKRAAAFGQRAMLASLAVALVALIALLATIANGAFGYVIVRQLNDPASLATRPLEDLSVAELVDILYVKAGEGSIDDLTPGVIRRLESEQPLDSRAQQDVLAIVQQRVVKQETLESFTLLESVFERGRIDVEVNDLNLRTRPGEGAARAVFRSWLTPQFLARTMNSVPEASGARTAILGSLAMIALTMLVAVPIGVGAAIYLEEYAGKGRLSQLIQTNINNLAGVPSILYGMLGLMIFVRGLEALTSGAAFGITGGNGRTLLSASLTMALLVLPILIINAQEAIRAVPNSLRQAAYGVGATKWETIRDHVLPSSMPGILTGTILALSRAMGETAPLIVVGASTFIVTDPSGPFSKFTALPILIYNWTAQPGEQYRNIAAAAIIVLLVLLISLNAIAIVLRNRYGRRG